MKPMNDQKYLFTIKIPVKAIDDVEARGWAKSICSGGFLKDLLRVDAVGIPEMKLQRIHGNKPPESVKL